MGRKSPIRTMQVLVAAALRDDAEPAGMFHVKPVRSRCCPGRMMRLRGITMRMGGLRRRQPIDTQAMNGKAICRCAGGL